MPWQDKIRRKRELSPRVKMAIRLYATCAAKTKGEAARMAGLSPSTMYIATSPATGDEKVTSLYDSIDQAINDKSTDLSALIQTLGSEAIREMGRLMLHSGKDEVRLKAAMELAERHAPAAKVTRLSVQTDVMSPEDAKRLAEALVTAAKVSRTHAEVAEGDFVKVDIDKPADVAGLLGPPKEAAA